MFIILFTYQITILLTLRQSGGVQKSKICCTNIKQETISIIPLHNGSPTSENINRKGSIELVENSVFSNGLACKSAVWNRMSGSIL